VWATRCWGETRYQLKAYAQAYPMPLCYCAKLASRSDQWAHRQREQLMRHLRYLATAIDRSRFRAETAWSDYRQFLARIFADKNDVDTCAAGMSAMQKVAL
jgi:hypothetical protein